MPTPTELTTKDAPEWFTKNIARPDAMERVVTLQYPVALGGLDEAMDKVTSLTLRKPKVGQILKASRESGSSDESLLRAIAACCNQPRSLLEELYASDWEILVTAFEELRFPLDYPKN